MNKWLQQVPTQKASKFPHRSESFFISLFANDTTEEY